jgi:uncharacterized RDD family membrane protein YckC
MGFNMNSSEALFEQSYGMQDDSIKAKLLNRIIAKAVDFLIVVALLEIMPTIGFFAGLAYLLVADGLFQGRSIGKRIVGLKVVYHISDDMTVNCGYKESVLRNSPFAAAYVLAGMLVFIPLLGWLLAFAVIAAILIFEGLVMLGSEDDMRLGDEIAKTRVLVDKEGRFNVS